jgi:hypothetical protein
VRSARSIAAAVIAGVKGLFGWPPVDPAIVVALERAHAPEYVIAWAYAFDDDARLWAECPRADRLLLIAAAAGVDRHVIRSAFHAAEIRARLDAEAAPEGASGAWARDLEDARDAALRWVERRGRLEAALTLLRDALEELAARRVALITDDERRADAEAVDDELRGAHGGEPGSRLPIVGLGRQRELIAERRAKAKVEAIHRTFADAVRATISWTVVDDALHHRYEGARGPYR